MQELFRITFFKEKTYITLVLSISPAFYGHFFSLECVIRFLPSAYLFESVIRSFFVLPVLNGTSWQEEISGKAAHKILVKLTPLVNFTNILRAAFAPILFCQKITKPNCN